MKRFSFSLPLVALLMSGCATSPPREVPDVGFDIPASWTTAATNGEVEDGWIFSFNDPRLRDLVMEAIRYNPDLEAAEARLRQAYAIARGDRERPPGRRSAMVLMPVGGRRSVVCAGVARPHLKHFSGSRSSSAGLSFDIIWELDRLGANSLCASGCTGGCGCRSRCLSGRSIFSGCANRQVLVFDCGSLPAISIRLGNRAQFPRHGLIDGRALSARTGLRCRCSFHTGQCRQRQCQCPGHQDRLSMPMCGLWKFLLGRYPATETRRTHGTCPRYRLRSRRAFPLTFCAAVPICVRCRTRSRGRPATNRSGARGFLSADFADGIGWHLQRCPS
jgi:hypothetical protein